MSPRTPTVRRPKIESRIKKTWKHINDSSILTLRKNTLLTKGCSQFLPRYLFDTCFKSLPVVQEVAQQNRAGQLLWRENDSSRCVSKEKVYWISNYTVSDFLLLFVFWRIQSKNTSTVSGCSRLCSYTKDVQYSKQINKAVQGEERGL